MRPPPQRKIVLRRTIFVEMPPPISWETDFVALGSKESGPANRNSPWIAATQPKSLTDASAIFSDRTYLITCQICRSPSFTHDGIPYVMLPLVSSQGQVALTRLLLHPIASQRRTLPGPARIRPMT